MRRAVVPMPKRPAFGRVADIGGRMAAPASDTGSRLAEGRKTNAGAVVPRGDDRDAEELGGRMGGPGRYWLLLPKGVTK